MTYFEKTYQENYRKMFCIALKMINDKDTVHDILQDVFECYYLKSQNGYDINQPRSWLIRATINKCIDYSRVRKRFAKIETIEPVFFKEEPTEISQDKKIVRIALSKLNPREKVLALLYSEGMSYKEISEISDIRFSSVGKMLSRTLKKLNGILKKMNYEMH